MSNNKQSSVEWLVGQLKISTYWKYLIMEVELMECGEIDIIEQAKAMHREEIIDATCLNDYVNEDDREIGERYYNETFGGQQ